VSGHVEAGERRLEVPPLGASYAGTELELA
jgi:hypothetical protein